MRGHGKSGNWRIYQAWPKRLWSQQSTAKIRNIKERRIGKEGDY